jgi:type I restriction enzyme M protein
MKDGPKNRLRDRRTSTRLSMSSTSRKAARLCAHGRSFSEIEKNEFNLNLPRYIDSQQAEDRQDIEGHICRAAFPRPMSTRCTRIGRCARHLKKALFKANAVQVMWI